MNLARTFLVFVSSLLLSISTWGATVNFYTTNYTGVADTNAFRVYPVGEPILANGGIVTRGLPIKLQPDTNGFVATNLTSGNYLASNAFMVATFAQTYGSTRGILFAVPSGTDTHNVADLAISGFNTYNYTAVGAAAFAAADTVVSNGLSARLLATNTALAAAIVAATNGITSGTSGALTNNETRDITLASNLTVGGVFSLGGAVEVAAGDGDVWNFTSNLRALEFYGNGTGLTNIPLTGVEGLTNALDWLTNNAGGSGLTEADIVASVATNAIPGSNVFGTITADAIVGGNLTVDSLITTFTNAGALATDGDGLVVAGTAGLTEAQVVASTLTNTAARAEYATNLYPSTLSSTNLLEDKTRIFVTGTVTPSAALGEYRVSWTNSTGFQGVWTNVLDPSYYIFLNRAYDVAGTGASFILTRGTNSNDALFSTEQVTYRASSGSVVHWENPLDLDGYSTGFYGGAATLAWGTNQGDISSIQTLGTGTNSFPLDYYAGTVRYVATNGNDSLPQRTNNYPYATLWAANEASSWGDVIEVLPGHHYTYGIHMKRGVTIRGSGAATVVEPQPDPDYNHPTFFQSPLISVWDSCTIENLIITNGAIGFTQHEGTRKGGTNGLVRNVTIYPGYLPAAYPEIYQQSYFGYGVKFSRLGDNHRCENVKVFTSAIGFAFQSSVDDAFTNGSAFILKDCEVIAAPDYLGTNNYWASGGHLWDSTDTSGGMIPIAFTVGSADASFNYGPIVLNIDGGRFASLNGATNTLAYVGGETNASRNAGIWIARGHTKQIKINLAGSPQFILGNTNTSVRFLLNEATNSNVLLVGSAHVRYVPNGDLNAAGTNYLLNFESAPTSDADAKTRNVVANTSQAIYGAGTVAVSSASMATMDFGTTDPELTVSQSGFYAIFANASGVTSSADTGHSVTLQVYSNAVAIADSAVTYQPIDAGLTGLSLPWAVSLPAAFTEMVVGDSMSLKWQSGGTSWNASAAHLSIIRLR